MKNGLVAYFVYNLNKYSGASQQALLLAKSVGVPVVIFNHEKDNRFSKIEINEFVDQINLPNNKLLSILCILYFIYSRRIKILHLHGFFKHGIVLGRILGLKSILKTTLMNSDDFETLYRESKFKKLTSFLFRSVDVNVCLTKQLKARNEKYISSSKIRVIPNGIELPSEVLTRKENIFSFVGLICDRKGTFESIEYYLKNYSNLPGSKMYVVGPLDGLNESDTKYVEKCYSLVSDYDAEEKVIFTGNVAKNEVQNILKICKALIFFSKNEGMPNVVLEAIGNNCLPITLGLDGVIHEIMGDVANKLTLKNLEQVMAIEALDSLICDSTVSAIAKSNFSIDSVGFQYQELYRVL